MLGLATAALAYFTVLRLGLSRWIALVPASAIALTPDAIYFEHTLLSEPLFAFLLVAAIYAVARALQTFDSGVPGGSLRWLAAAGLLLALATVVRTSSLFLVPLFSLVVLLQRTPLLRTRTAGAATLAGVALVALVGYAALQSTQNGYFGLTEGSGWSVYSRTAPFADCREFYPPAGTEGLCESTPADQRGGPDFYAWDAARRARRLFIGPPYNAELVGAFGRAALFATPRAYIRAVASDLWRYVDPNSGVRRIGNGAEPDSLDVARRYPEGETLNRSVVEPYYGKVRIEVDSSARTLADLQRIVRVHGVLVLLATLLSLIAIPFATASERLAILLLGGSALLTIVLSTALSVYNWRYAVPVLPLLLTSGATGGAALVKAILRRVRGTPVTAAAPIAHRHDRA